MRLKAGYIFDKLKEKSGVVRVNMSKEIDPREPKRAVAYELWMKAPNLIDAKD